MSGIKKYVTIALIAAAVYIAHGYYHMKKFRDFRREYNKQSIMLKENKDHLKQWSRFKTPEQEEINKEIKKEIERLEDVCNRLEEQTKTAHARMINPLYRRF